MNKFVSFGLGVVAGLVIGATASYLFVDKEFKKYVETKEAYIESLEADIKAYKDRQDKEFKEALEPLREAYNANKGYTEIVNKLGYNINNVPMPECEEDPVEKCPDEELYVDIYTNPDNGPDAVIDAEKEIAALEEEEQRYEEMVASEKLDEENDEYWAEMRNATTRSYNNSKKRRNKPYLITIDEYYDDDEEETFEKVNLSWYEGDGVLAEISDAIIESTEYEMSIGKDPKIYFEMLANGEYDNNDCTNHIVYVRNPRLETDYEIVKEEGTYRNVVLGE